MRKSYNDFIPSKLETVKEVLVHIISRLIEENNDMRVGAVAFYGSALPLLPLTRDKKSVIDTLSRLRILGEGSAPGNGLVEAVKLMRRARGFKKTIIVTDGGFNAGIPLDIAALYARNMAVKTSIIVIGSQVKDTDIYYIDKTIRYCGGSKYFVETKSELLQALHKDVKSVGR